MEIFLSLIDRIHDRERFSGYWFFFSKTPYILRLYFCSFYWHLIWLCLLHPILLYWFRLGIPYIILLLLLLLLVHCMQIIVRLMAMPFATCRCVFFGDDHLRLVLMDGMILCLLCWFWCLVLAAETEDLAIKFKSFKFKNYKYILIKGE